MRVAWVDGKTRIVVCRRRAAALSINEFTIFWALYRRKIKRVLSSVLWDEVYRGVADPPVEPAQTVRLTVRKLNAKKLAHLDLKIVAHNHRHRSYYELVSTNSNANQENRSV